MIEGLQPYAEYKESGERWLGQLPASWKLRRAKFLFREVDERSRTGKEELLSVSHKTGVTPRSQKNVTMFMAESNVGHKICRPQDLVINTLWAWMAALGVSKHTGIVSPAYGVYRPIDTDAFLPLFADQLLRTPFYADEYQRRSTGVNSSRLRLYPEAFFRIPVVLPPPDEQAAIVRFLDHANRKIDGFIRAKRKLIALLGEQKQAIIHRAVTRGLNPNAPLKPSGIPWLGDIPKHWEVKRLKWVTRMGRYGSTDAIFYLEQDFWPHNTALFVTTFYKNVPKWCFYLLSTISKSDHASKSAVPGVDRKDLYEIYVPHPPADEQPQIVTEIEEQTAIYDTAIFRTEREIALMQEYRTRLTADVVTGKLDVRGAAAKLSEQSQESVASDVSDVSSEEPEESLPEEES
jgi:type I restriction enzyme S subunit